RRASRYRRHRRRLLADPPPAAVGMEPGNRSAAVQGAVLIPRQGLVARPTLQWGEGQVLCCQADEMAPMAPRREISVANCSAPARRQRGADRQSGERRWLVGTDYPLGEAPSAPRAWR